MMKFRDIEYKIVAVALAMVVHVLHYLSNSFSAQSASGLGIL